MTIADEETLRRAALTLVAGLRPFLPDQQGLSAREFGCFPG
jgi:hypothetical protein